MNAMHALIGFTLWTLLLVACVFLYRSLRFVRGTPINNWPRGNKPTDDAAFIRRMEDAHANCMESLPIFAIIVFASIVMGQMEAINTFAVYAFYLRIAQSTTHLIGVGQIHVFARATFWSAQVALYFAMLSKLLP